MKVCSNCGGLHPGQAGSKCVACLRATAAQRNRQPHRQAHRTPRHKRLRERVFLRDNYQCVQCGATSDLTLDYLRPLQHGGTQDEANARCLCRSCNSRRGAKQQTAKPRCESGGGRTPGVCGRGASR